MQLLIDAGNTLIKAAVFDSDKLIKSIQFDSKTTDFSKKILDLPLQEIKQIAYCSVVDFPFEKALYNISSQVTKITSYSNFPFTIIHDTPATIGIDRLVACAGARRLEARKNILVIDLGTCITYDFLTRKNEYKGGAISPGLRLRAKAMHNYTAKLPLVEFKITDLDTNTTTTEKSLISGVLKGTLFELKGFIAEKKEQNDDLTVFLTGGDAIFFEDALKNDIFAQQNLNLIGLNELLKINA